jgi:hypothetical protein
MTPAMHIYESRPRSDKRAVNLISDALASGRLWASTIAFAYAQQREFFTFAGASRGTDALPAARWMSIRGAHSRS